MPFGEVVLQPDVVFLQLFQFPLLFPLLLLLLDLCVVFVLAETVRVTWATPFCAVGSLEVIVHVALANQSPAVRAEDSSGTGCFCPSTDVVDRQPPVTLCALPVVLAAGGMTMVSPEATDWALSALCAVRFEELPGSEAFLAVRAGLLLMGKKKCFRNKVYMNSSESGRILNTNCYAIVILQSGRILNRRKWTYSE